MSIVQIKVKVDLGSVVGDKKYQLKDKGLLKARNI